MEKLGGTNSVPMMVDAHERPMQLSMEVSFMRVYGSDCTKQLRLPEEFVVSFNGNVPKRFFIETAAKQKCWKVQVEQDANSTIYLRDGWGDFVESNSLEVGDVLIFEYEEKTIFRVKIYGINGCEKIALLDLKSSQLGKRTRSADDVESEALKSEEKISSKLCQQETTEESSQNKHTQLISEKQHVAFGKRKEWSTKVTDNGFSVTMHKTKRYQFQQLSLPMAVSVSKLRSKEQVVLKDINGHCWPVKVVRRKNGRGIFSLGWKQFIQGNAVACGDTLDFVFISDDLIQVCVTKGSLVKDRYKEGKCQKEDMSCEDDGPATCREAHNTLEAFTAPRRIRPCLKTSSFSFTRTEATRDQYLHFPKAIAASKKLKNKQIVVLRDSEGRSWPLEIIKYSDNRTVSSKGWREFWNAHNIAVGDTLKFVFVSEHQIQVNIKRGKPPESAAKGPPTVSVAPDNEVAAKETEENGDGVPPMYEEAQGDKEAQYQNELNAVLEMDWEADEPVRNTRDFVENESLDAQKRASCQSGHFFSFTWRKTTNGAFLTIPYLVVAKQNLRNKESVMLRDPKGKCWPIELKHRSDGRVALTKGWSEFWQEHNITAGDTLKFYFVSEYLIQVHISRVRNSHEPLTEVKAGSVNSAATSYTFHGN